MPSGTGRRPAIRVNWNPSVKANGVRWQYQLLGLPADQDPLIGGADYSDDDLEAIGLEVFEGEPLLIFDDTPVISDYFADVLQGTALIMAGILPATVYGCAPATSAVPGARGSRSRPRTPASRRSTSTRRSTPGSTPRRPRPTPPPPTPPRR